MFCFPQFSVSRAIPTHSGYLILKVATAVIAIGQICLWRPGQTQLGWPGDGCDPICAGVWSVGAGGRRTGLSRTAHVYLHLHAHS